jgi:hypothetical protein
VADDAPPVPHRASGFIPAHPDNDCAAFATAANEPSTWRTALAAWFQTEQKCRIPLIGPGM